MHFYDSTNCEVTVMGNQNSLTQLCAFSLIYFYLILISALKIIIFILNCNVTMLE